MLAARLSLALVLTGSFLIGGMLAGDQDKSPAGLTVDDILTRFIKASGGAEALESISTRVSVGTLEISMQQKLLEARKKPTTQPKETL